MQCDTMSRTPHKQMCITGHNTCTMNSKVICIDTCSGSVIYEPLVILLRVAPHFYQATRAVGPGRRRSPYEIDRTTLDNLMAVNHCIVRVWLEIITARDSTSHDIALNSDFEAVALKQPLIALLAQTKQAFFRLECNLDMPTFCNRPSTIVKTSTIHSYQTLRSSVCRHILTSIEDFGEIYKGVCIQH